MNRRKFLTVLGVGSLSGLSGCSMSPFTDSPKSNNSTKPSDSDLDGVPDKQDYAPWDDSVQNKSDVIDEYWGKNISPDDAVIDETAPRSLFARGNSQAIRSRTNLPGESVPDSMSTFSNYDINSATIDILPADVPDEPFRLFVVAREFPRRGVVSYIQSDSLTEADIVNITFDDIPETEKTLYYSAFLTPDRPLDELNLTELTYLHETNPFKQSGETISSVSTEYELEDISGTNHGRTSVEGGYAIKLQGRSAGSDWSLAYFISQSAYEIKRMEPRGRQREEYARYALSHNSGSHFMGLLRQAASGAGFSTKQEQADFAIDVVQSLPYVTDEIGTGYDDYTKFIEETLVDIRGDCEDTTVTLAVFLHNLGYDIVLIEFPTHIGVGIAGDYDGSYVSHEGTQYYYVETTSEGWAIGDIPEVLDTSNVLISPL